MSRLFPLVLTLACAGGPDGGGDPTTGSGSPSGSPQSGSPTTGTPGGTPGGTGGGTTTVPIPEGWVRVDTEGGARAASVDASIGDDGTLWVSWMDDTDRVLVGRSRDGGNTWDPPVVVTTGGEAPLLTMGRQPYVHAGPDAVWVTYTTATSPDVKLFRSDLDPVAFVEVPIDVGAVEFVDYAKVATTASGEAWVTWLAYAGADIWPVLARENAGFASSEAGNFPDLPCECCRNDLVATQAGSTILVFRGNNGMDRDMWSLRAAPGVNDFGSNVQVSHTNWMAAICPMQGPRMAQLGDGTLLATWADPTAGPWQVWTARSVDDGQTWSGDVRVAPGGAEQRSPDLAADGTDVWVTFDESGAFALRASTDGGASFGPAVPLDSGPTDLSEPQVEARSGVALVVGANAAGEVVLDRLK